MTLGQKKSKAIEQLLEELNVPSRPIPTEQICVQYNDLRYDLLLIWYQSLEHSNKHVSLLIIA